MERLHIVGYNPSDDTYVVDVLSDDPDFDYGGVVDDFPAEEIHLIDDAKEPVDMIGKIIEATDFHISCILGIG